jgi:hypothetical protein
MFSAPTDLIVDSEDESGKEAVGGLPSPTVARTLPNTACKLLGKAFPTPQGIGVTRARRVVLVQPPPKPSTSRSPSHSASSCL